MQFKQQYAEAARHGIGVLFPAVLINVNYISLLSSYNTYFIGICSTKSLLLPFSLCLSFEYYSFIMQLNMRGTALERLGLFWQHTILNYYLLFQLIKLRSK